MKNIYLSPLILVFLLFLSSCQIQDEMTDSELIDAIINSDQKIEIIESDLPNSAKNTIEIEMPDDFFDKGNMDVNLGYEISLRTIDFFAMGSKSENIYFDLKGRELKRDKNEDGTDDKGDDKKKSKKKKNCFYLEYPITLKFPDNSTVEIADRKAHCEALKSWHKDNPESKERVVFVFPINIYWVSDKEEKTQYTVNSHEEMREIHAKCQGEKDKERKN